MVVNFQEVCPRGAITKKFYDEFREQGLKLGAVTDTSTQHILNTLDEIFILFGNPKRIITDAGKAFVSKHFSEYTEKRDIRVFTTAVGMARGNGQVETANKTVLDVLATTGIHYVRYTFMGYKTHKRTASTKYRIIQTTPSELFFGYKLRMDEERYVSDDESTLIDVTSLRKEVAQKPENNRAKQNEEFNKKRRAAIEYMVGDLVITKVTNFPANNGESKKLLDKYRGSFRIVEVLPNDRYRVKDVHSTRSQRPYKAVIGSENIKLVEFQKS
ncbi:uncharacterized protein [Diabrotica undecimpunctata]|uniref:uncharacterized protein n=1 Tax=Diabrotica undecimpunctata TaxID=50387 RepID=UPI003B6340E4